MSKVQEGDKGAMKTISFGIFAHPDDETFGPSATFIKAVHEGADVHLISVTTGQHGMSDDETADLGDIRLREWWAAGEALGARSMHALDFEDGCLCNRDYQIILAAIEDIVLSMVAGYKQPIIVHFVTFDSNGLSGHLDHIAVSYIVTKLYYQLELPANAHCGELAYFCLSHQQAPEPNLEYFVFMPAGRDQSYINRVIDVQPYLQQKYAMMRLHHSQRHDAEVLIAKGDWYHRYDHFHVIDKRAT